MPVLPKKQINFVSAPMPFVMGVHSQLHDEIMRQPLEPLLFVYLDEDRIQFTHDSAPTAAGAQQAALAAALQQCRTHTDDAQRRTSLARDVLLVLNFSFMPGV